MRELAATYEALDASTSTLAKVAAVRRCLERSAPADAAWAVFLLSGRRLKRIVPHRVIINAALAHTGLPEWLYRECYASVGDTAETVTLLVHAAERAGAVGPVSPAETAEAIPEAPPVPKGTLQLSLFAQDAGALNPAASECSADTPLSQFAENCIEPLRSATRAEVEHALRNWFACLPCGALYVALKLLTGALRVGVSRTLVERAVAEHLGLDRGVVAHRMMGEWRPSAAFWASLTNEEAGNAAAAARPYPFYLASPMLPESSFDPDAELRVIERDFGPRDGWRAEWKYDGIRAQLIRRGGEVYLWSRGDEHIGERFPEITEPARSHLPDGTVIDGEVLAWRDGQPLPFGLLQQRIGRTSLSPSVLRRAPAALVAYDLLEHGGEDLREQALERRVFELEALLRPGIPGLELAPAVNGLNWRDLAAARATSRERRVEGLMLKRLGTPYRSGRVRGDWWKWKIEPLTIDAVLVYAQPGSGRRASLLTDYTFAVWDGGAPGEGGLVPVAKAYSGVSDDEIRRIDAWVRRHTTERFGPVRRCEPVQVFELAFEGVNESDRHKTGVAVRFPRIKRWRTDKPPEQADTIAVLQAMIDTGVSGDDEALTGEPRDAE